MKNLKDYGFIIISNFILAIATIYLILPYDLMCGGMSGLTLVVYHFIKVDKTILIAVLMVVLFMLGWLMLGSDFAKKTLLSSITYPIFVFILERFQVEIQISPLLAGIYAGILSGFAIGLTMRVNGSTGGMDIPPLIISKYTGINVATLVLFTDGIIIAVGTIIYGLNVALIGIMVLIVTSFMINKTMMAGTFKAKKIEVITERPEELNETIIKELDYGSTISEIKGGYSNKKRLMITCIIYKQSYQKFIDLINRIDEKAFVIVTDVYEVQGEGFSYAKRLNYFQK